MPSPKRLVPRSLPALLLLLAVKGDNPEKKCLSLSDPIPETEDDSLSRA